MTSAPNARSSAASAPACSRERVTRMRSPANGDFDEAGEVFPADFGDFFAVGVLFFFTVAVALQRTRSIRRAGWFPHLFLAGCVPHVRPVPRVRTRFAGRAKARTRLAAP